MFLLNKFLKKENFKEYFFKKIGFNYTKINISM